MFHIDASKNGALVGRVCKDIKGPLFPTFAVHSQIEEYAYLQQFKCLYLAFMLWMMTMYLVWNSRDLAISLSFVSLLNSNSFKWIACGDCLNCVDYTVFVTTEWFIRVFGSHAHLFGCENFLFAAVCVFVEFQSGVQLQVIFWFLQKLLILLNTTNHAFDNWQLEPSMDSVRVFQVFSLHEVNCILTNISVGILVHLISQWYFIFWSMYFFFVSFSLWKDF